MKAVSNIIAIIMLVMISVSLVGGYLIWSVSTSKEVFTGIEESQEEEILRSRSCLKIKDIDFTENKITIENCGQVELKDFVVYADDIVIGEDNETILKVGEILNLTFTEILEKGLKQIKVSSNYREALMNVNIT